MIRALVDFALNNKFVVLAVGALLAGWGAISFHNLPVEAYPDIADNYVTVITQWPGRSAEEVEQQRKSNSRLRFPSKYKWPECRT
jgi:cobalt-zinc-cadmium resistance protein CzcA